MLLEYLASDSKASFVTLTYSDEYLPNSNEFVGGELVKKDLQDFIKRFRKNYQTRYGKQTIRYYAVGEYGSESKRAHYHLMFFGLDPNLIDVDGIVKKSWTKCDPHLARAESPKNGSSSIRYLLKYVTKQFEDTYTDGRLKPFSLKSQSLGRHYISLLSSALKKHNYYPRVSLDPLSQSAFDYIMQERKELIPDIDYKLFDGRFFVVDNSIILDIPKYQLERIRERNNSKYLASVSVTPVVLSGSPMNKMFSELYPDLLSEIDTFLLSPPQDFWSYHQDNFSNSVQTSVNSFEMLDHFPAAHSGSDMTLKEFSEAQMAKHIRLQQKAVYAI